MRTKVSVFGHPIHPMLVSLPIGLFAWTFVADIVFLARDEQMWYDIAFWSGIAGVISALVAALPGLGDFVTSVRNSDARDIGLAHMVLNLMVVALFFVAMLLMLDNGATDGVRLTVVIVLHAFGLGVLGLSGWLGGELVYRYHVGIVPDTVELERTEQALHQPEARRRLGARPR